MHTSSRIPSANRETRNNGARIENICETVMNKLLNARLYTQRRHRKARQTDGRASMWADGYCLARETRGRETPLFLYYSPPTSSDHVQRLSRVPRERSSAVNSGYFLFLPGVSIRTFCPVNGKSGIRNNVPSIIKQIPGFPLLIIPLRFAKERRRTSNRPSWIRRDRKIDYFDESEFTWRELRICGSIDLIIIDTIIGVETWN